MRVQFAVDCITLAQGLHLAEQIRDYIEIIELGEEFIARYWLISRSWTPDIRWVFPASKQELTS